MFDRVCSHAVHVVDAVAELGKADIYGSRSALVSATGSVAAWRRLRLHPVAVSAAGSFASQRGEPELPPEAVPRTSSFLIPPVINITAHKRQNQFIGSFPNFGNTKAGVVFATNFYALFFDCAEGDSAGKVRVAGTGKQS
ncbi:MAG: hypothetical protein R2881_07710 [Eubacteriales bacterium]